MEWNETIHGIDRNGMAQLGIDSNLYVRFYMHAEYQGYRSEKEQRPIFEDKEYVEVIQPGAKSNFIGRATREFRERFPVQYAAFKANQSTAVVGTPIENLPRITVSQREMLKHMKILTIEQLAAISDSDLQGLGMGGIEMRNAAQTYLVVARDAAAISKQQAENDALRGEIDLLRQQMQAMLRAQTGADEPRRRGRPRKEDNDIANQETAGL